MRSRYTGDAIVGSALVNPIDQYEEQQQVEEGRQYIQSLAQR